MVGQLALTEFKAKLLAGKKQFCGPVHVFSPFLRLPARRILFPPELKHIPKTLMVIIQDNLSKKIDNADLKAYYNILCDNKNQDHGCQSCDQSKAYRFQDTSDMIFHQFLSRILLYFNKLDISPLRAHMGCELQIQIGNLELLARAIEAAR